MRTTVTLDDDLFSRLQAEVRASGRSFRAVLNQVLREGFQASQNRQLRPPPALPVFDLGLRAGLSYDSIEALLEAGEGPLHG